MRLKVVIPLLFACVYLSRSQGSGWTVTLSDHRVIDSLSLTGRSGDSLRATRNHVPFVFAIDELAQMREPAQSNFLSGILFGGIVGFAIFETSFAFEVSKESNTNDDHVMFLVDSFNNIAYDFIGILIGMTVGGIVGLHLPDNEVYEFRDLKHDQKIALLESIFEDAGSPIFQ